MVLLLYIYSKHGNKNDYFTSVTFRVPLFFHLKQVDVYMYLHKSSYHSFNNQNICSNSIGALDIYIYY